MNRDDLYTARWHLLEERPVPSGGPLDAMLDVLRPLLGAEPGADQNSEGDHDPVVIPPDVTEEVDPPWQFAAGQTFPIVGRRFSRAAFDARVKLIEPGEMTWNPQFCVLHNTAAPDLSQRPDGFTEQHMVNLRDYYRRLGWKGGPHLFVDDHGIWIFNPLTRRGTHSPSWNYSAFGVEMLGDYHRDDDDAGRGRQVIENAAYAVAVLEKRFALTVPLRLHKEDPKTDHDCPGDDVDKSEFRVLVAAHKQYLP